MITNYFSIRPTSNVPRLPLEGNLDLTYRCNNTCRHCWLWLAPNASEQQDELTFEEIRKIADDASSLGTRIWRISGGEPMLRDDFADIFDYLTRKTISYSINTNGTLITPAIARLLKRKGSKMIALYGASTETYTNVTHNSNGFEQAMRGFRYMKEAGAGFTVQLIPMRANWHEWDQMQVLAKTLSPHWRLGATWLYKSAYGSPSRNAEIECQRLDPHLVIELEMLDTYDNVDHQNSQQATDDDRLFASCIAKRRDFYINPYGLMTWCSFIKDPSLMNNLRVGTFREAWDNFIPSCANKVHGGDEWRENCGSCVKRADCRWCAAFAYLETGRYSARVPYLCALANELCVFKRNLDYCR
jgi:MoaA/NifB/PqqE/SkfB family radical SAM enzyme